MYVRDLSLTDFRNWPAVRVAFEQGPNVLVGPNGQGKTNLVEAVAYAASMTSHRTASDGVLVRSGAERAVVRTAVVRDDRELLIELEINPGRANRARLNRAALPRAREVLGVLRTVLFAPEDLATVRGDPAERRRFLDDLLVARTPRYAGVRADYERVLKQRNALLKTAGLARRGGGGADLRTLDVWNGHLARHGAELVAGRRALTTALAPHVAAAYAEVSQGDASAEVSYAGSLEAELAEDADVAEVEAALLADLERLRGQEVDRGVTLVGPHRDDLMLRLGGEPARGYASQGESWSYALALKLAAYELLRADGAQPVLILDDVFAELDSVRRERLAAVAGKAEQVLITAAVAEDVPPDLHGNRYDVTTGEVRRVG